MSYLHGVLLCLMALTAMARRMVNATTFVKPQNPTWKVGEYYVQQTVAPSPFRPWTDYRIQHPSNCSPGLVVCIAGQAGNARHDMIGMHWVHAAEVLLNCWPVFNRFVALQPVVHLVDRIRLNNAPWVRALRALMGCRLTNVPPTTCAVKAKIVRRRRDGWPGQETQWLTDRGDADMLKFLLRRMDHQQVASNQSAPALQVGVLTRTVRGLGDGPNIFAALQKALPDAEVNITTFDHMKFPQQAGWVNRHDIIVCPHGAQNLNFLFVRHCAVVLEVYPHKYYIPGYYLSLARLAGARAFEAYPGPNALQDGRRTAVDAGARQKARVETIAITAADVLQILPALLEARLQCLAGQPEANLTSVQLEGEARSSQGAPDVQLH